MTAVLEKPIQTRLATKPLPTHKVSEREFVAWCEDSIWAEWVDGEIILMSPIGLPHAQLFQFLNCLMNSYVEDSNQGAVITEPYQIRFGNLKRRRSPDIFFIAKNRMDLLTETELDGAPDLIVEIVSPGSVSRDWRDKFNEYQAAGVREYWVVDPQSEVLEVYTLHRGKYKLISPKSDKVYSMVLKGFWIRPQWLWKRPLPRVSQALKEICG